MRICDPRSVRLLLLLKVRRRVVAMWRAIFIGCIAVALAEDSSVKTEISKRQIERDNRAVYRASPDQYILQSPEREEQNAAEYQSQSDLYVIRKPGPTSTYVNQVPKRSQNIQLAALQQLQLAQQLQADRQHRIAQQQQQQQQSIITKQLKPIQQQISYSELSEADPRSVYRTAPVSRPQQSRQYSVSAIVNTPTGSFEKELAQLVAANRQQEEKYTVKPTLQRTVTAKRPPPPQQYLKEITRPTARPLQQTVTSTDPVQYRQPNPVPQDPALYRYVYQPEQTQVPVQQEPQYVKPHLQQYQSAQPQLRDEEVGGRITQSHATAIAPAVPNRFSLTSVPNVGPATHDATSQSHSTIYVSQGTLLKKLPYPPNTPISSIADKDEEELPKQNPVPVARVLPRNRPFTQEEFQRILQSGRYTATLVPSDNPNSPQQEYILHPANLPRQIYANEKQPPYLVTQQQPIKRRPGYNVQQQ